MSVAERPELFSVEVPSSLRRHEGIAQLRRGLRLLFSSERGYAGFPLEETVLVGSSAVGSDNDTAQRGSTAIRIRHIHHRLDPSCPYNYNTYDSASSQLGSPMAPPHLRFSLRRLSRTSEGDVHDHMQAAIGWERLVIGSCAISGTLAP